MWDFVAISGVDGEPVVHAHRACAVDLPASKRGDAPDVVPESYRKAWASAQVEQRAAESVRACILIARACKLHDPRVLAAIGSMGTPGASEAAAPPLREAIEEFGVVAHHATADLHRDVLDVWHYARAHHRVLATLSILKTLEAPRHVCEHPIRMAYLLLGPSEANKNTAWYLGQRSIRPIAEVIHEDDLDVARWRVTDPGGRDLDSPGAHGEYRFVARLRRLARQADLGPWVVRSMTPRSPRVVGDVELLTSDAVAGYPIAITHLTGTADQEWSATSPRHAENAAFMAAAREGIPQLCDEIDRRLWWQARLLETLELCKPPSCQPVAADELPGWVRDLYERAEAADPAPWHTGGTDDRSCCSAEFVARHPVEDAWPEPEDMIAVTLYSGQVGAHRFEGTNQFIVAARAGVPALCGAVADLLAREVELCRALEQPEDGQRHPLQLALDIENVDAP